jgi:hypothetical protein
MQEPSFSQSRPRSRCLGGTFKPSSRQSRATRLVFAVHPAARSSAVIRR